MASLNRWVIRLCAGLAIAHYIAAFTLTDWVTVVTTGWFDTRLSNPPRDSTVWFFIGGTVLLVLISLARLGIKANGAMPAHVGVYLLVVGVPMTIFQPVSGGIGVVLTGAVALFAWSRSRQAATANATVAGL